MVCTPRATTKDIRRFRRICSQQRIVQRKTKLGKLIAQIDLALGRPLRFRWRNIHHAEQEATSAIRQSGSSVQSRHGVGIGTQFLQIFWLMLTRGICASEYYLYQLYLPERWRNRDRQFPRSQTGVVLDALVYKTSPDAAAVFDDKVCFAKHFTHAGLPTVPTLAVFAHGRSSQGLTVLPAKDLFSKPTMSAFGQGARAWRFDKRENCFYEDEARETFTRSALFKHFCKVSESTPLVLQCRLSNNVALAALSNGALCTVKLITCKTPDGFIELMPPILRMPAGPSIVDNLARGGLAVPIDLKTGVITGPAFKKEDRLGAIWLDRHPDTGEAFEGFAIPMWPAAVHLARRAHQMFPAMCFIGWDLALLAHGWVLIEGESIVAPDLVLPHKMSLSDTQFIPYFNYHWAKATQTL